MAFYRFHIDAALPPHKIVERLRRAVRTPPGFGEYFRTLWSSKSPDTPPFIGSVHDAYFRIHRDIRYRNSFLPFLRGRLVPTPTGTRVVVTMYMHPFTTVFMLFWLGGVGFGALANDPARASGLWVMFIFGVALCAGGFVPEALRAKNLLCSILSTPG